MFSFSPMNNLSKYYCHLCLISSSFTSNQSIIINAFNLIEVSRLPFMNPSHSICPSILCLYLCVGKYPHRHDHLTYNMFCSLLCHLKLLYVVHTLVMVQAPITFFLLNSLLDILVPIPSIISFVSSCFSHSKHL